MHTHWTLIDQYYWTRHSDHRLYEARTTVETGVDRLRYMFRVHTHWTLIDHYYWTLIDHYYWTRHSDHRLYIRSEGDC